MTRAGLALLLVLLVFADRTHGPVHPRSRAPRGHGAAEGRGQVVWVARPAGTF